MFIIDGVLEGCRGRNSMPRFGSRQKAKGRKWFNRTKIHGKPLVRRSGEGTYSPADTAAWQELQRNKNRKPKNSPLVRLKKK